jgi:cysteine desulfurase
MKRIYADWNATTPPLPEVIEAMTKAARDAWANPSSIHGDGRRARAVVEDARAEVAALVGADARDVLFTGGGTEANNLALRSAFAEAAGTILTSRLEHPSVAKVAEALEREGRARVRWLAVTRDGRVSVDDLERALDAEKDARLLSLQAVNAEHGVVQPLAEAIARAKAKNVAVHVDAIQALGKLQNTPSGGADFVSIAAHKMRGPKGIGALVTREGAKVHPVLLGGSQERGLRPGTVDPALAAGFGAAAAHARRAHEAWARVAPLRDALEQRLETLGLVVVGKGAPRVPHVTCVVAPGWIGAELVAALDLEGVSASSGSACSAGTIEPSPVLAATIGEADAARGLRLSLGPDTTHDEIEAIFSAVSKVLARAPRTGSDSPVGASS